MSAARTRAHQRVRVLALLQAAIPLRLRIWVLVPCVLMLSTAVFGSRVAHDVRSATIYLMPFSLMSIALIWHMWVGRLALMQSKAESLRLPGIASTVRRALAIVTVVTVLVPGLFLVWSGVMPIWALSLPVIAALWGLLAALSPAPFAWALLMLPIVGSTLAETIATWFGAQFRLHAFPPIAALACIGLAAALVAWRWRVVASACEPERLRRWQHAMLFNHTAIAADEDVPPSPQRDADTRPVSVVGRNTRMRADHAGPHDVGAAIGACFGGDLGERPSRDALKQWSLLAVVVLILLANPLSATSLSYMRDAVLWGGVSSSLAYGWLLARGVQLQQQRASGAHSELALLPGLGSPDAARQAMVGLMLRRLARLLIFMLAGLALAAWTRELPAGQLLPLGVMWLGVAAGSVMLCLRALAGRSLVSRRALLMLVPLIVLTTITMTLGFFRIPEMRFAPTLLIAWPLLISAYLVMARGMLQHYRARAHPFLLQ